MTIRKTLPVVSGAVGAAVDCSELAALKTITVSGIQGTIVVEIGIGGRFSSSFTIQDPDDEVTVQAVCDQLRVDAREGAAATVEVAAERARSRFIELPAPAGPNQAGTAVDVSQFGDLVTALTEGRNMRLEISQDGVNFSQVLKTFEFPGAQTGAFACLWARARSVGSQTPEPIMFAAQESVYTADSEPQSTIVFRYGVQDNSFLATYGNGVGTPFSIGEVVTFGNGATAEVVYAAAGASGELSCRLLSGQVPPVGTSVVGGTSGATATLNSGVIPSLGWNPGDNVYADWESCYEALRALRHRGQVFLEFDSRFSPQIERTTNQVVSGNPQPVCVIPAGQWSMENVIWTNNTERLFVRTNVWFEEGCKIDDLSLIEGNAMQFIYDGLIPGVFTLNNGGFDIQGNQTIFVNTIPDAEPMIVIPPAGFGFIGPCENVYGGFGPTGTGTGCAAPLIEVQGSMGGSPGSMLFGSQDGWIDDNCFKGNGDALCSFFTLGSEALGRENVRLINPEWQSSNLIGITVRERSRYRVQPVVRTDSVFTECRYNELIPVFTTFPGPAAPRVVPLRTALQMHGERAVVKDADGQAAVQPITVQAPAGQTIDRRFSFAYDGLVGGPFVVGELLTFSNGAVARLLVDAAGSITAHLLTGFVPADNNQLTGGTSGAIAFVNGSAFGTDTISTDYECRTYACDGLGNWYRVAKFVP